MPVTRSAVQRRIHWFLFPVAVLALAFPAAVPAQDAITPGMQPRIDAYKKKAERWAADPVIVNAVRDSNAKGPIPGMANAKWRELKQTDPVVQALIDNPAGQLMTRWMNEDPKGINKMVLSGNKSHRVAFTSLPAAYIGKGRPNFDTSFDEGKAWQQGDIKPDPGTGIPTVQVSVPVKDGKQVIGVLLVSLTATNLQ